MQFLFITKVINVKYVLSEFKKKFEYKLNVAKNRSNGTVFKLKHKTSKQSPKLISINKC
jgi:hypothetical protein